jgi:hypothetical protein
VKRRVHLSDRRRLRLDELADSGLFEELDDRRRRPADEGE